MKTNPGQYPPNRKTTNHRLFGYLLCFLSMPLVAWAQTDASEGDSSEKDERPKHYLTFQFSYQGTASKPAKSEFGQSESHLAVTNQFSGRIEVQPTEAYDLPTDQSAEAQLERAQAMQAAVLAGDVEKMKQQTPQLVTTWFPQGDQVEITGTISERMKSSASQTARGESRASSDHRSETYECQKMFAGTFSGTIKIRPDGKRYDLQFTLMPDMTSTWEAVQQIIDSEHIEEGHNSHTNSQAKVPLDMGPGQMVLGYSNYKIAAVVKGQPLLGETNELTGTTRIPVPKPAGWHGPWDIALCISWQLDLKPPPLELIITAPGYADWRPSTTRDAAAGLPLEVKATVVATDGKRVINKVKNFIWDLEKTSREPGIAMNYPLNAKDDRLDMELTTQGGMFVISPDAQRVDRPVSSGLSDTVTVLPFDWGGWSDLKVTAIMENGPPLIGRLEGSSEQGLRLPKRAVDSKIADAWKKQQAVTEPDDADSDNIPAVPAHTGDGLTLYEEYRGFYEQGQHVEGNPEKKDLFVLDTTKLVAGGLNKFEQESKIIIHRLAPGEMDEQTHLINQNRAKGPHLVAQHGILIKFHNDAGAYMAADPQGAASPGGLKAILVPHAAVTGPAAPDGTPYPDVSFAHELMHALGVRHHGDGDYDAYWKIEGNIVKEYRLEDDGSLSGSGKAIEIFRENGTVATAAFIAHRQSLGGESAKGLIQLVGVDQGEGSGDDTCMMRYDRNSAYLKRGQPNGRVSIQPGVNDEPVGYRICTSPDGTGVNAFTPGPSRFGNAAANRGNCAEKLKVSDY
jgi:hypothetical protein